MCDDGSTATVTATGSTCADGSEPGCVGRATPTPGSDGTVLYCTPAPHEAAEPADPACSTAACPPTPSGEFDSSACESGGDATRTEDGSFACADGSEPACPEGTTLTLTDGETALVCEVPAAPDESS